MNATRRFLWGALLLCPVFIAGQSSATTLLNPELLTKYMDPLPIPGPMPQVAPNT